MSTSGWRARSLRSGACALVQINLNWKPILKNILEDPEGFIADGGWDFLDAEGGSASEGDGEGAPLRTAPCPCVPVFPCRLRERRRAINHVASLLGFQTNGGSAI